MHRRENHAKKGTYYMVRLAGETHAPTFDCEKENKNYTLHNGAHFNPQKFFNDLRKPVKRGTGQIGENPPEFTDPDGRIRESGEISMDFIRKYHLYLASETDFGEHKLSEFLINSRNIQLFIDNLYEIEDRVIVAEPVAYSRDESVIQYRICFVHDDHRYQLRFNSVYDDPNALDQHIRRIFYKDKAGVDHMKAHLALVFGNWRYIGHPNSRRLPGQRVCCSFCRLDGGCDPGCYRLDEACLGLFQARMEIPARHLKAIKEDNYDIKNMSDL